MKNDSSLPAAARSLAPCKHTPGPFVKWQLAPDSDPEERFIITTQNGETEICGIVYSEDDADLFAAAPELLDALRSVWGLIESGQLQRNTSGDANPDWAMRQIPFVMALKKMQMAIDKANGVSSQGSPDGEPPQGPPEKIDDFCR